MKPARGASSAVLGLVTSTATASSDTRSAKNLRRRPGRIPDGERRPELNLSRWRCVFRTRLFSSDGTRIAPSRHPATSKYEKAVRSVPIGIARCAMAHVVCRGKRAWRNIERASSADSCRSACPDGGAGIAVWAAFQANAFARHHLGRIAAARCHSTACSSSDGSARPATVSDWSLPAGLARKRPPNLRADAGVAISFARKTTDRVASFQGDEGGN